ncbi:MAG: (2Fe-2S)-binding protein [bacterium]
MSPNHRSPTLEIEFRLNGRITRTAVPPAMSALEMLRGPLGLTGTKYGCGEGECGACTIEVDGRTVNACLLFAVDCDGREIVTIEGLGSAEGLDPLQQSFVNNWAVQCGYCIPGMVMQARHIVGRRPAATVAEIKRGLEGNLCRCTGYKKIVAAVAAMVAPGGATNR